MKTERSHEYVKAALERRTEVEPVIVERRVSQRRLAIRDVMYAPFDDELKINLIRAIRGVK